MVNYMEKLLHGSPIGQIIKKEFFNNGDIHGIQKEWKGNIYKLHTYKNGTLDGISQKYSNKGRIDWHRYYINGTLFASDDRLNNIYLATLVLQSWIRKILLRKKYKNFIFLVECLPPNMPGTMGKLFPNGGYLFQEELSSTEI